MKKSQWDFYLKGQYHLVTCYFEIVHLLDINFCANNNCSKVFILKKSCLWRDVSSCLHSTRRRYIVSINMASIKAQHCLPISGIQIILFFDRYNQMQSQFSRILIIFPALLIEINLLQGDTVPLSIHVNRSYQFRHLNFCLTIEILLD